MSDDPLGAQFWFNMPQADRDRYNACARELCGFMRLQGTAADLAIEAFASVMVAYKFAVDAGVSQRLILEVRDGAILPERIETPETTG